MQHKGQASIYVTTPSLPKQVILLSSRVSGNAKTEVSRSKASKSFGIIVTNNELHACPKF